MKKFTNVAEAFNHYMESSVKEIEQRAAEIDREIDSNPAADLESLNIELEGLQQAKENIEQRSAGVRGTLNRVSGMSFQTASKEATEGDVLASPEYRSAFYKTMLGHKLTAAEKAAYNRAMTEQRADAYSTTSEVAAVIPTQTLNEVISKARTMGGLMAAARGFQIPANLTIPVGTPSAQAAWNTEGAMVESTEPSVAPVTFGAYEILKVFSISAAVKRMSVPAFENYLAEELAACVMATLADGLVNGTGSAQGTGIMSGVTWVPDTNSFTYASTGLTYADIVNAVGALKRGFANGAKFAMNNRTLYSKIYGLVDSNKRPIFVPDPRNDIVGRVLGFEVVVDDNLADGVILFGNFNYLGYNLAEGIMVEASTQSSFKSGRVDYRALAIADCKPIVGEAFIKLEQGA